MSAQPAFPVEVAGPIDGDGAISSDRPLLGTMPAHDAENVADFSGAIMLKLENSRASSDSSIRPRSKEP
jgi:hypothetical protein